MHLFLKLLTEAIKRKLCYRPRFSLSLSLSDGGCVGRGCKAESACVREVVYACVRVSVCVCVCVGGGEGGGVICLSIIKIINKTLGIDLHENLWE